MIEYCRVDLSKTNYELCSCARLLTVDEIQSYYPTICEIYKTYCRHKQFKSVVPLFYEEFLADRSDVIGYFYEEELIAWSLIARYDRENIEGIQFAWDYKIPELRLGIESLKHECAYYKQSGYVYFYLGEATEYKSFLSGYEILGEI